jgi:hypothetical protein
VILKTSKRELFGTLPFRLAGALTCTPYYGKCRTKFPDKVLGVLNIDLANRVIQHLTGVATGSNAQQKHTPQTKVASDAGCRFHIADTQPAPFAEWKETEMLFIGMLR